MWSRLLPRSKHSALTSACQWLVSSLSLASRLGRRVRRVATTVPGSLNGAALALQYVRTCYEVGQYPLYEEDGYRLLLASTERAICTAAGLAIPYPGVDSR